MTQSGTLDPRSKLVIVLCLSSLGILIQDAYMLLFVLLVSSMASVFMGSSLFSIARKMRRVLYLFAAIALIQSIFSPSGKAILSIGNFSILTEGGVIKGVLMVLRIAIILVSATIMTTSNSREIVQGFVQWKIPYEIAFMVSVAVRFLPLLTEEIKDTMTAIQLRGVDLKRIPLKKRIKIYSYILMPVVMGTIIKSQELATAMEMRAFRAYPKRTSYMMLKMNYRDYAVISISLALCLLVMTLYYV